MLNVCVGGAAKLVETVELLDDNEGVELEVAVFETATTDELETIEVKENTGDEGAVSERDVVEAGDVAIEDEMVDEADCSVELLPVVTEFELEVLVSEV